MASKKLLTIVGATGNQGGSIIDHVLASPQLSAKYSLRGITRDASSSKAQTLTSRGVEMVTADLDDVASLTSAFQTSHGVFGVTDFWTSLSKATETQQGKNIYTASLAAGVTHLVFSSLPATTELSGGKYTHIDHFDSKAEAAAWMTAQQGASPSGTKMLLSFYQPAYFIHQWPMFLHPSASDPKTTNLVLPCPDPDVDWPSLNPRRDSGKYILGLLEAGKRADGAVVQGVSCWTTLRELCEKLSTVAEGGKRVELKSISMGEFELGLGEQMPQVVRTELAEMMAFFGEQGYYGPGARKRQGQSDEFLLEGAGGLLTMDGYLEGGKPWFADA